MSYPKSCDVCGSTSTQTTSTQYGKRTECFSCGAVGWNDRPLITKELAKARTAAHDVFDLIWKRKYMTRSEAYKWLRNALNYDYEPHMMTMNLVDCRRVVVLANEFLNKVEQK